MMVILRRLVGSRWWNPGERRERRGARLTRRVREEPPPGELARVYFDRNATQNTSSPGGGAQRSGEQPVVEPG